MTEAQQEQVLGLKVEPPEGYFFDKVGNLEAEAKIMSECWKYADEINNVKNTE